MQDIATINHLISRAHSFELPGFGGVLVECDFAVEQFSPSDNVIALPASLVRAVPKRQAEFVAGRWCARLAMQQLGLEPVEVAIGKDRAPVWPPLGCGSITHAGPTHDQSAIACCALAFASDYRGIGVDIENLLVETTVAETQSLIIDAQERALLLAQDASWPWLMTLVFSAKESLFKALYPSVGRYFDFLDARLVELDLPAQRIGFALKVPLAPQLPAGFRIDGQFVTRGQRLLTLICY
jgi:enterobactin synthetase component D